MYYLSISLNVLKSFTKSENNFKFKKKSKKKKVDVFIPTTSKLSIALEVMSQWHLKDRSFQYSWYPFDKMN